MVKGVPILLNMLSETKDPKVRRAVVTALSNVSIIEGFGAKDVWLDKGIELMIPYIGQSSDLQLQIGTYDQYGSRIAVTLLTYYQGALNTIANVCNHDKAVDLKRKVAQLGGIGRYYLPRSPYLVLIAHFSLVPLLESQDEMVVKLAAMTVANMASEDAHCSIMHSLHIEEPLIRLLDSRDEEVDLL